MPGQIKRGIAARALAAVLIFTSACAPASASDRTLKFAKDCRMIGSRVVSEVAIPAGYHEGMEYDGKSIWLCNGEKGKIWIIDPASGTVTSEIEPVADFAEALTSKGDGTYYATEWYTKKAYRVRLRDNKLVPESEASFEPAHPAGAAWNGSKLFVVTWHRTLLGTKFAVIGMDQDMKVLEKVAISSPQEPDQLTWDGKHLWMTSWYDQRVYKIDTDCWQILGFFCSPVKKTTGIAWDGKYFWITGTYGGLYKIELDAQS